MRMRQVAPMTRQPLRPFRTAPCVLATLVILAACEAPSSVREATTGDGAAPAPELAPTSAFRVQRLRSIEDTARVEAESAELAARSQALRDRTAALEAPVLTSEERDRLDETIAPIEDIE